jgi:hypothetical protein
LQEHIIEQTATNVPGIVEVDAFLRALVETDIGRSFCGSDRLGRRPQGLPSRRYEPARRRLRSTPRQICAEI